MGWTRKVEGVRSRVLDSMDFSILESFPGEPVAGGVERLGRHSLAPVSGGDYEADDCADPLSIVRSQLSTDSVAVLEEDIFARHRKQQQ
jgi:hypothetical protein